MVEIPEAMVTARLHILTQKPGQKPNHRVTPVNDNGDGRSIIPQVIPPPSVGHLMTQNKVQFRWKKRLARREMP
jgi:hypothetical protein